MGQPNFAIIATQLAERCCERVQDHPSYPDLEMDVAIQVSKALGDAYTAGRCSAKNLSVE